MGSREDIQRAAESGAITKDEAARFLKNRQLGARRAPDREPLPTPEVGKAQEAAIQQIAAKKGAEVGADPRKEEYNARERVRKATGEKVIRDPTTGVVLTDPENLTAWQAFMLAWSPPGDLEAPDDEFTRRVREAKSVSGAALAAVPQRPTQTLTAKDAAIRATLRAVADPRVNKELGVIPRESPEQALLRIYGAATAFVEPIMEAPNPNHFLGWSPQDLPLPEVTKKLLPGDEPTLGEAIGLPPPELRGLPRGEGRGYFAKAWINTMHRIETNHSLVDDFKKASEIAYGPNSNMVYAGMALGLLGEVALSPETHLLKGTQALAKTAQAGQRAAKLAPQGQEAAVRLATHMKAAHADPVDVADTFGDSLRVALAKGLGKNPDEIIPPDPRYRATLETLLAERMGRLVPEGVLRPGQGIEDLVRRARKEVFQGAVKGPKPKPTRPPPATRLEALKRLLDEADPVDTARASLLRSMGWGEVTPPTRGIKLGRAGEELVDIAQEAMRAHMRAVVGDENLISLTGLTWGTPTEHARWLAKIREESAEFGIEAKDLAKTLKGGALHPTDDQVNAINRWARVHGLDMNPIQKGKPLPTAVFNDLRAQRVEKLAGQASATRFVLKDTKPLSSTVRDFIFGSSGSLLDTVGRVTGARVLTEASMFTTPGRNALSRPARIVVDSILSERRRNGTNLFRELADVRGKPATEEQFVREFLQKGHEAGSSRILRNDELALVARTTMPGGLREADEVLDIQNEILKLKIPLKSDEAAILASTHPPTIRDAIGKWTKRRMRRIQGLVEDVVRAYHPGIDLNEDTIAKQLRFHKPELWRAAYEEVYALGKIDGPNLEKVMSVVGGEVAEPGLLQRAASAAGTGNTVSTTGTRVSSEEAMLHFVLNMRDEAFATNAYTKLVSEGMALPKDSNIVSIATKMLTGKSHYYDNLGQLRAVENTVEAAQAMHFLQRNGLMAANGDVMGHRPLKTSRNAFALPAGLENALAAAAGQGKVSTSQIASAKSQLGKVLNEGVRRFKLVTTFGGLLNFANTNILDIPFIAWRTIGLGATAGAIRHPAMAVALTRRTSKVKQAADALAETVAPPLRGFADPLFDQRVFTTQDGRIFTQDDLLNMVRQQNVDQSHLWHETARSFLDTLRQLRPAQATWVSRNFGDTAGAVSKQAKNVAVEGLIEISQGMERSFRIGVFLDALHSGKAVEEAGDLARRSLFDYSDLTKFERSYMRAAFTFYTFEKKNLQSFAVAMLDNPAAIAAQIRIFSQHRKALFGVEDKELLTASQAELAALAFGSQEEAFRPDGQVHPHYRSILTLSNGLSTPQGLFLMHDIAALAAQAAKELAGGPLDIDPLTTRDEARESFLRIMERTNPYFHIPAAVYLQESTEGRDLEGSMSRRVPDYYMQTPFIASFIRTLWDVRPEPVGKYVDIDSARHMPDLEAAQLGIWAISPDSNVTTWHLFNETFGRPAKELAKWYGAFDLLTAGSYASFQPNPWEAHPGHARQTGVRQLLDPRYLDALGFHSKPVLRAQEAKGRAAREKEFDVKDFAARSPGGR